MPIYDSGDGADGAVTITSSQFWADTSYICTAVNGTALTVTAATSPLGIRAGDEIMLIHLQGSATTTTTAGIVHTGKWEILGVASTGANLINTVETASNSVLDSGGKVMVIRVPNYTNFIIQTGAILRATPFKAVAGSSGIIAFKAKSSCLINGLLMATSAGFTCVSTDPGNNTGSYGGDSWGGAGGAGAGIGVNGSGAGGGGYNTGAGGSGWSGGGGGGNSRGTSNNGGAGGGGGHSGTDFGAGGGAGYGSAGGQGLMTTGVGSGGGLGGGTFGVDSLNLIYLGPAGGCGGQTNIPADRAAGGSGGGIVWISARYLTVAGTGIQCNASMAGTGNTANGAGGGGSAGGSVYLKTQSGALGTTLVTADSSAARLGKGSLAAASGGAGGVGRIAVRYDDSITGTTFPTYTSIIEDFSIQGEYSQTFTETMTLSDSPSWTPGKVFIEAINLSDTLSRSQTFMRTFDDTVTLTGETLAKAIEKAIITDGITMTDSISRVIAAIRSFNETITLTDTSSQVGPGGTGITEIILRMMMGMGR